MYHRTFIWPADGAVAQRLEEGRGLSEKQQLAELQRYRREVTGLTSAYQHVLKVINADQPHTDVYQQGSDAQKQACICLTKTIRHHSVRLIRVPQSSGSNCVQFSP